jgi:hypothetical protein
MNKKQVCILLLTGYVAASKIDKENPCRKKSENIVGHSEWNLEKLTDIPEAWNW